MHRTGERERPRPRQGTAWEGSPLRRVPAEALDSVMMEADDCCPLCMEELDVTDRNFRPCKCGYQICLFCYRHIKDDLNGLCPACRTPYDEANVTFHTPDPQEMAKMAKEKRAKELRDKKEQQAKEAKEKREAELKSRQEAQARAAASLTTNMGNAASSSAAASSRVAASCSSAAAAGISSASQYNSRGQPVQPGKVAGHQDPREMARDMPPLRVVQRALVYVMGLSPRIAKEEILRRHEYFGQYGKILRIQVNTSHLHSTSNNGPPSLSCYISYSNREEAEQAILAVDGVVLDGRTLKASFGQLNGGPAQPELRQDFSDYPEDSYSNAREDALHANSDRVSHARDPQPAASSAQSGDTRSSAGASTRAPERSYASTQESAWDVSASGQTSASESCASSMDRMINSQSPSPTPGDALAMLNASADRAHEPHAQSAGPAAGSAVGSAVGSAALIGHGAIGSGSGAATAAAAFVEGSEMRAHTQPLTFSGLAGTGGEAEPWSMLGNFEELLSGIVIDDAETEEESTLPGSSRFARFFDVEPAESGSSSSGGVGDGGSSAPASALASLRGTEVEPAAGAHEDDWQQGFRALLPNVNISFSPFGDSAMPPPGAPGSSSSAPSDVPVAAAPGLGLGGLGALSHFGTFCGGAGAGAGALGGSAPAQQNFAPQKFSGLQGGGTTTGAFSTGSHHASAAPSPATFPLTGSTGAGGAAELQAGNFGLGPASLNGSGSLPTYPLPDRPAAASSEMPLLGQLSASTQLPGAQLGGSQLSSQLQSLLQGSCLGAVAPSARAVGGGLLSAGADVSTSNVAQPGGTMWAGSSAPGLMPGWVPPEGLLNSQENGSTDAQLKDAAGMAGVKSGKKDNGGSSGGDRGNKAKKRGGTNNRGKAGSDARGSK